MAAQAVRTIDQSGQRTFTGAANNVARVAAVVAQPGHHQQNNKRNWLWYLNADRLRITAEERLSILINLREFYAANRAGFDLTDYLRLTEICQYLCDWQLQAAAAMDGLALWPENPPLKCRLLTACWQAGDYQAALTLARRYLLNDPGHPQLYQCYQQIFSWQDFVATQLAFASGSLNSERLYLQPFGHQHAEDFFWQYADPRIGELCCLPVFHNLEDWHQWLSAELADNSRNSYAIMHPVWGFIGVVCLIRYEELGFFYYWLGRDFQGQGFGPEAVSLLLDHHVNDRQMTGCFAKVYNRNQPSIKAMARLGFAHLPFDAETPGESEHFYYQGAEQDLRRIKQRLVDLLRFLDADINLVN